MTFTVPIEKEVTRTNKNGEEITKNIFYRLHYIDSTRFIVSSLSNFVNNLSEGIHEIKYKYCDCFLEYINFKDDLIEYKCLPCNKNYQQLLGLLGKIQ